VPQVPQFRLFVCRSTQVPLHSVSPEPVSQVPVHAPAVQRVPRAHRFPQAPQFAGSLDVSVHVVPHSVSDPQEQLPATQSAPDGHGELHAPQLLASFKRSTHAPPQSVRAGPESVVHEVVHFPSAQAIVAPSEVQTFPHAPQLFGSLWVAVHTPLHRSPPFEH
jgi:hypothetical protein